MQPLCRGMVRALDSAGLVDQILQGKITSTLNLHTVILLVGVYALTFLKQYKTFTLRRRNLLGLRISLHQLGYSK